MRTAEIRRRWLDHFEARDHVVVPSASLVSEDPTLLFTVAGMVPFIPYMLGEQQAPYKRATSVQKCVRTLDIEEVGKTVRHGTFFQMNGNFSFGDYFKEGAIQYAWELVTNPQESGGYGFNPDDIWVTVYEEDDEAESLWRKILPADRIQRLGMKTNYWSTGQPGPAGPCSEIFVDRGPQFGREGGPAVDEDRYLEIWNLVFMQYQRGKGLGKDNFEILGELQQKNIDTGMGLERVAYLLQGVDNMYEIDEVFPVIARTAELTGKHYGLSAKAGVDPTDDVRFRVVADHVRSALMLMNDGVTPGNEGRGHILRRLMRRAIRSVRLLGYEDPALTELLPLSRDAMKESYPDLVTNWDRIHAVASSEEDAFRRTLVSGTQIFDLAVAETRQQGLAQLPGDSAFALHDTYGFPLELTLEMAAEAGLTVDEGAFRTLMTEQKQRARADALAKKAGHADITVYQDVLKGLGQPTDFLGYTETSASVRSVGLLVDGQPVPAASAPADIDLILDQTPFWAEAGGQLADQGSITFESGATVEVDDVQAPVKGLSVHRARLTSGTLALGDKGFAEIDLVRRGAISRSHTATHMVHKAVQEHLGSTATQAGSENSPSRVRFDFKSTNAVPAGVLSQIEGRVNEMLIQDLDVEDKQMPIDEARASGAMALFGEKYGDVVRVVSIGGDWSRELCAGTHVKRSGLLGNVILLGEASIGSGVRRVDALVGSGAYQHQAKERALLSQVTEMMKVRPDELPERISSLMTKLRDAEKTIEKAKAADVLAQAGAVAAAVVDVRGVKVVAHDAGEGLDGDNLRALVLDVRTRLGDAAPVVVAGAAVANGRPLVVIATNQAARDLKIAAGALVKVAAGVLGGGGGGKPDLAQGGGQDPAKVGDALAAVKAAVTDATA
ncbi:alanine--tRNA ligase [Micrococcales bacterium 31B]|nr:alanine--tRNA ligase [Micrococcales bacterium 31B]